MTPRYRQRLTGLGYAGLALAVVCPFAAAAVIADFADRLAAGVRTTEPTLSVFAVAAMMIGGFVGLVMILVGREHFAVSETDAAPAEMSEQPYQAAPGSLGDLLEEARARQSAEGSAKR